MNRWKRRLTCLALMVALVFSITTPKGVASPPDPFMWYDAFCFINSSEYFGDFVMTPEEVSDNLRNYMFQLLYSDIRAACEVSVLDIMLLRVFDSIVIDLIDQPFEGICGGMAAAARDYYLHPERIPLGRSRAFDLPSPNTNETIARQTGGDVVESAIKEYFLWKGSQAFFNVHHLLRVLTLYLGIPENRRLGTSNSKEYQNMVDLMHKGTPFYQPVVLLLMQPCWKESNIGKGHFVLAYDYEPNDNGTKTIYIYDNQLKPLDDGDPITADDGGMGVSGYANWILLSADDCSFNGTHLGVTRATPSYPATLYSCMAAYPETPEYTSILGALIDLASEVVQIFSGSPVELRITDPMGRTIGLGPDGKPQLGFPAIYTKSGESTYALIPCPSSLPYKIDVIGTGTGNYTVGVNKVVDGQLVSQSYHANTTAGETDTYSLALTSEGANFNYQAITLHNPTGITPNSMKLEWTRYNDSDFSRYEIYQSATWGALGTNIYNITDPLTTAYTAAGLTPETAYHYTVRVVNTAGRLAHSNQVSGTTTKEALLPYWLYALFIIPMIAIGVVLIVLTMRRRKKAREKSTSIA